MAPPTRSSQRDIPPFFRHPLLVPGALLLLALLFMVADKGGAAAGFLLAGLGAGLYTYGRDRRWRGAPGAGLILAAVGLILALAALLD